MNPTAEQFLNRLKDHKSTKGSLGRLSNWIEKHTSILGKPYSFKDHEYARDICDDTASQMVIIKCSQSGASELAVRQTLALMATTPSLTAMYGLFSVLYCSRFFKSRIDPVIRESDTLSSMVIPAADSSSFKQLNNGSQLHGAGFSPGISVISVACSLVTVDEYDFCDPQAIATAESRLSHSPLVDPVTGQRGIRKWFSTPTVANFGVDGLYLKSDMKRRLVRCRSCTEWFWPNLLEHAVIDGWDRPIRELTAVDASVLDDKGLLPTARLLCPKCHNEVTAKNLGPEYREWVAERPDVTRTSGWAVSPHDLPVYHTPESLFRKLITTGDHAIHHWYNYALGLPYTNALNSVREGAVSENTETNPVFPDQAPYSVSGCVAGIDVGKISWITIGKLVGGDLHIVYAEQIRLRDDGDGSDLEGRLLELLKQYRVVSGIIDAYPYTDTILRVISRYPALQGAEYSVRDKALPMMITKDDSDVIRLNRNKTLAFLVKRVNTGHVKFPLMKETAIVDSHLRALRQIERIKDSGETIQEWTSVGPDHYAHSLNYCHMAAQSVLDSFTTGFAMAPTVKQANVGSKYRPSQAA